MSGDVIHVRNHEGVLLRFEPALLGAHHVEQKPRRSDLERIAVLKAESALRGLEIIAEHAGLSDLAQARIADAVYVIRRVVTAMRKDCGLS